MKMKVKNSTLFSLRKGQKTVFAHIYIYIYIYTYIHFAYMKCFHSDVGSEMDIFFYLGYVLLPHSLHYQGTLIFEIRYHTNLFNQE